MAIRDALNFPNPSATGPFGATNAAVKTLLLVDLVDSTRLLERLGDARAQQVFAQHDQLARGLLAYFDGREIDKSDGFLLLFERPIQAVGYALAYHRNLVSLGERLDVPLEARAGIHLGEVFLRENAPGEVAKGAKPLEVEGLAKHTVARVAGLAHARQTLLTHAAFDLARRAAVGDTTASVRPSWLAHGPYLFQGIDEPVEVFEVGLPGLSPLSAPHNGPKARRAVAAGDELTLGWRPAVGQEVPWRHHWRLERKLGEGGFGEVWLARHENTRDHRVFKFCYDAERLRALKREVTLFRLLKDSLGERNDITRILDWNLKEAPFFLEAEYTGTDLRSWAGDQGGIAAIPLETRLEIVAQVATALAAAHSVGVLHKDIKPSNVLISLDEEGRPRARLTDFGIGLLADSGRAAAITAITMDGWTEMVASAASSTAAGTHLYLAPELLEGKVSSIQSDIYALGVLLYQMAVGDLIRALAPGWEREISDEILAEDIAACVDGDPAKRLRSAAELAERLRRLEERRRARAEALQAAREAEENRLALLRSRRRRRLLAAFTSLVLVFAIAMAFQMRRTAQEAKRANQEAEAARRVSEYLVGLFEVTDPDVALADRITARELLDQGAVRIETELQQQPEVRATLMHTMGQAYAKLGVFNSAVRLLRSALETRRRVYGRDSPEVADSLEQLAGALLLQGQFDEADSLFREALDLRRRLGGNDLAVAETLRAMAGLELERGSHQEAERLYREALQIYDALGQRVHPGRAGTLNALAVLAELLGKAGAEQLYDQSLALWRQMPHNPTSLAGVLGNKGRFLMTQGRYAEAEACFQEALTTKRQRLGDNHPSVAYTLYKLAELQNARGQHRQAEALCREALRILNGKLPDGHWRIAFAEAVLASSLTGQKRFPEAEKLLLASYPILRDAVGTRSAQTRQARAALADLYKAWGRPAEAARYTAEPPEQKPVEPGKGDGS